MEHKSEYQEDWMKDNVRGKVLQADHSKKLFNKIPSMTDTLTIMSESGAIVAVQHPQFAMSRIIPWLVIHFQ